MSEEQTTVTITVRYPGGLRVSGRLRLGLGVHAVKGADYDKVKDDPTFRALCKLGHVSVLDQRPKPAAEPGEPAAVAKSKRTRS